MISAMFVGIMLLVMSPVSCTSGSESHILPNSHKSACNRHRDFRTGMSAFRDFILTSGSTENGSSRNKKNSLLENAVKLHEKEFRNCSTNCTNSASAPAVAARNTSYDNDTSLRHQPQQLGSLIMSQPKSHSNVGMSNQIVRKSKCRDIQLYRSVCCARTVVTQAVSGRVRSNETKFRCQPLEKCPFCTKAKSKAENTKNVHKRLQKREALRIFKNSELSEDAFPVMSGSLLILQNPKRFDRFQKSVYKYSLYAPFDGNEDHIVTNKRRLSNESMQLTPVEFNQLVDLLGHNTFKDIDGKPVDINQLCEQLTRSGTIYADTIKSKLQCDHHQEIKQGAGYVTALEGSLIKPCRYSRVDDRALESRESSGNNEINSNDVLFAPCVTYPEKTAQKEKTVMKKSQDHVSNESSDSQGLVITQFGSCSHHIETRQITLPGCVPKSVLITRCHGNCHSSTVPDWDVETQEILPTEHCTCCSAHEIKFRTLRFHCPRRPEGAVLMTMGFPFQCACRPCATVPEVSAEQPYDY